MSTQHSRPDTAQNETCLEEASPQERYSSLNRWGQHGTAQWLQVISHVVKLSGTPWPKVALKTPPQQQSPELGSQMKRQHLLEPGLEPSLRTC